MSTSKIDPQINTFRNASINAQHQPRESGQRNALIYRIASLWAPVNPATLQPIFPHSPPLESSREGRTFVRIAPAMSPDTRPQGLISRQRDPRDITPDRTWTVKQEITSPLDVSYSGDPSAENENESVTSDQTIDMQSDCHATADQNDELRPPSPLYSQSSSEDMSADSRGVWERQHDLFKALECICTHAARYYSRSEHHQRWSSTTNYHYHYRPNISRHHPHCIPHINSSRAADPFFTFRHRDQQLYGLPTTSLLDYIYRISDSLWQNARTPSSHWARLEAVHRIGNLYAWADILTAAVHKRTVLGQDQVYRAVLAARDLAGWCLCEEGKGEIDSLWAEWMETWEDGEIY